MTAAIIVGQLAPILLALAALIRAQTAHQRAEAGDAYLGDRIDHHERSEHGYE